MHSVTKIAKIYKLLSRQNSFLSLQVWKSGLGIPISPLRDTELEKGFFQNKVLRDFKFGGMVVLDKTLHSAVKKIASHIPLPW